MQLKVQRSQRDTGIMSKTVVFCLDARVEFSPQELANIKRYKLHNEVIYNSAASKKFLDSAQGVDKNELYGLGSLKQTGLLLLAGMHLNISIASLQKGQHIECKSMDELLAAEDAIMIACRNLKEYLATAATFDGREVLIDFSTDAPTIIAAATAPSPMLIAPAIAPAPAATAVAGSSDAVPTLASIGSSLTQPAATSAPAAETGFEDAIRSMARQLRREYDTNPAKVLIIGGGAFLLLIWLLSVIF